jgi:pyrroloquinoline quinone biosynthesis protein B
VHLILLGTAAGGGFPQWNCWCPVCRVGRSNPKRAIPRTQSTAAVSADGERWFLLNASPDIRGQLQCLPGSVPRGTRHVPVEGVITTDAELDHTLGIVLLREARRLQLYATRSVQGILRRESRLLPITEAFAEVAVTELPIGKSIPLRYRNGQISGISVESFEVPGGPPRFAPQAESGHTIGLTLRDDTTRGSLVFVPGCGELDQGLLDHFEEADLLLFDGTFWSDDELVSLGISDRRAREMDHLPVSGRDGSLARLARLTTPMKVYTHINNTNPMLLEESPEREVVEQSGFKVGSDGTSFTI